jgi:hypothetical protein
MKTQEDVWAKVGEGLVSSQVFKKAVKDNYVKITVL